MKLDHVKYEVDGAVATITQNRPERRNAQGKQMLDEMDAAFEAANANDDVRVIVLTGAGDHFSAGHDLKEGESSGRQNYSPDQRWEYEHEKFLGYCLKIRNSPKPTIAKVDGACIAGAFMVANMCDLVVATDRAFFADPVVHTMAVAGVEVLVHPWRMGSRKAREFLFTGERMSALEAKDAGMVNRIATPEELDSTVESMAGRIASAPPFALKMIKRSLNRTEDIAGYTSSIDAHFDGHVLTHFTAEATRGKEDGGYSNVINRNKVGASVQ